MVLLTMTVAIVEGLKKRKETETEQEETQLVEDEPSLDDAAVGRPISHGQIVDLWKNLKAAHDAEYTLERLLQGSRVYVPPPPPKPEPSDEYKALMARLRREEEERQYQRMVNPPSPTEAASRRFPATSTLAHSFAEVNKPSKTSDIGDDEVTYNEVHRQLMLVLNFLVTIFGSAATLWILARWWSTPARLFLTMGGSLVVAIAEVAIYSGYIWHLSEAKKKDTGFKEVKEVVQTWVVGPADEAASEKAAITVDSKEKLEESSNVRRRRKGPS
ncbi:Vacuolar H+-ATPase assembly protein [Pleurostoma richardsiae]|uniref:Vacuolar H+-ATPase assembly protein n=1 Tax=Pleurostoma richardsiae TaxID=41990 RepID=A0AA38S287_9PEZI|nr:Vacuolar H+-ATPase assembly protein [Pleurostoma richardsiae]